MNGQPSIQVDIALWENYQNVVFRKQQASCQFRSNLLDREQPTIPRSDQPFPLNP